MSTITTAISITLELSASTIIQEEKIKGIKDWKGRDKLSFAGDDRTHRKSKRIYR